MSVALDGTRGRRFPEAAFVALIGCLVVGLHALVFARYLPGPEGRIGHDYAYFFPNLLAGAYWFHENGPFSIPWFTPAFGGGLPFYAHPASGYVSFPQAAALVGGPVFAVRATLAVFTALGFLGTYLCLRRTFQLSIATSAFGATLFAWNGFFSARMLVGHLGFHSQMLVPLAAWWITRPVPRTWPWRASCFDGACAGLVFAYLFQSGNFYGIVPAALACGAIAILAAWRGASLADATRRFGIATLVALALSTAKLSAALAFIQASPRTGYPLPGASNPLGALGLAFQSVFLFPSVDLGRFVLVNERWKLDLHEWDFRLTWVAGAILVVAAFATRRRWSALARNRRDVALFLALAFLLLVPIAVNVHGPAWTSFLKRVPIVQSSSNLVRWFVTYVPVFAVLTAIAFERIAPAGRRRPVLALVAAASVIVTRALEDRSYYAQQPYDTARIERAFRDLRETGRVPPIERTSLARGPDGSVIARVDRNDGLADGTSPIACYEPMFGYGLEWFPLGTLHAGSARERAEGVYNFKNPAGYLFPVENGVAPGGHFHVGQERELERFLSYRPFEFAAPAHQRFAEISNLVAVVVVLVALAALAITSARRAD